MKATILGASGFIGSNLTEVMRKLGHDIYTPLRDDPKLFEEPLGCVFYCIGLTADFRSRPYDTIDAHICLLRKILEQADYDTMIYLSSTRVYSSSKHTVEDQMITVQPAVPDQLYNISKLMGESLTLSIGRKGRVARLSNVTGKGMGSDNFLGSLLDDAEKTGRVHFYTSQNSSKDYIWITDVTKALIALAQADADSITNIASGKNITHAEIAKWFQSRGIVTSFEQNASLVKHPMINIDRLRSLIGVSPDSLLQHIDELFTNL